MRCPSPVWSFLIVLCLWACSQAAAAQAQPAARNLDPALAARLLLAADASAVVGVEEGRALPVMTPPVEAVGSARAHDGDAHEVRTLRRSKRLIAAGAGLLFGSIVATAVLSSNAAPSCEQHGVPFDPKNAWIAGGLLSSVGLTFSIVGGLRSRQVSSEVRRHEPARWWRAGGLVLGAATLGVMSSAATTLAAFPELVRCASS